jgi:ferredoxin
MANRCGICSTEHPTTRYHVITLTDEEKQVLAESGQTPPNEFVYCKPCWNTLQDPVSGPMLMKGLFQMRLRELGVSSSERLADEYHAALIKKIKGRPS